jgi:hypothetical protein
MGRAYQCTICGSLQVYHHCRLPVCERPTLPTLPIAVAVPVDSLPLAPDPPSLSDVSMPPPYTSKQKQLCQSCNAVPHTVARRGIHDGRIHDRLCKECFDELVDSIREHIPAPGKVAPLHKPGRMLMARWLQLRRIPRQYAVTVLYCKGELVRAHAMNKSGPKYVLTDSL